MSDAIIIREWNADAFHRRVLDLEAQGYAARLDSYDIKPEVNPETGEVIHLRTIEMLAPNQDGKVARPR